MAGKPKRSGPPGNTNASKYGWRVLVRRALIRPKDAWVNRPVDCYIDALRADKPEPSGAEQHAIEVAGTAKACSLLILNELKQTGFTATIKGVLELTPAARELSRFLTVELSALKLLGLERRTRAPISLNEYLDGRSNPTTPPSTKAPVSVSEAEPATKDDDLLNGKAAPVQASNAHDTTPTTDEAAAAEPTAMTGTMHDGATLGPETQDAQIGNHTPKEEA